MSSNHFYSDFTFIVTNTCFAVLQTYKPLTSTNIPNQEITNSREQISGITQIMFHVFAKSLCRHLI